MAAVYQQSSRTNSLKAGDILIADHSMAVSHCGICVGDTNGKVTSVIHATQKEIKTQDPSEWQIDSDVFRGTGLSKEEAETIAVIAAKIAEAAKYGKSRAFVGSWTGTSSFGTGAQERLKKYAKRLEDNQSMLKNVFCAELVILAYQVGLKDEKHRLFITLDAKHTLPKTLRDYLRRKSTDWTEVGTYKKDVAASAALKPASPALG